jgi:TonB-dependent SusC/RagA subfamily outer membrane receptor
MKTVYLSFTAFLLIAHLSFSQQETVTGVLLDVNNKVIKNYPVKLRSVSPVTVKTDKYGVFTFSNVNLQDTLFVGDKKGQNLIAIPINGHPYVTIKSLKGNFNTAYLSEPDDLFLRSMQQAEKDRKRSLTTLTREDIIRSGCRDVLCLLTRLSGITVYGNQIRIRGMTSSLYGTAGPLVVLDGVPGADDALNLPVEDIENISVLKDASMYGARGANGAIVINTRKR